jgi:predicted acylesterase/phospholipase RssA
MKQAREHLETVTLEAADPAIHARRAAARKRGAMERFQRLEAALAEIPGVIATKKRNNNMETPARVSTTDPQARVMKMADGGFRPAFNVQFATTTDKARVIVGVEVTNRGSDMGESTPMLKQIEQRTGVCPDEILADGGYAQHQAIEEATQQGAIMYSPVPLPRKGSPPDQHAARDGDSEVVAQWRERMGTEEAKQLYKKRAATAETVNADAKQHRGLSTFRVRGLKKVTGSAALFALTYNVLRLLTLTA